MLTKKDAKAIADLMNSALAQYNQLFTELSDKVKRLEECTMDYLRPCPFCGSDEITYYGLSDKEQYYRCEKCLCMGPASTDPLSAKNSWNRRS